jgi:hypothetical protein
MTSPQNSTVDLAEFDLRELIIEALSQAEERGMTPPFILLAVSPNGSAMVVRIRGDGTPGDELATHYEPEGFRLPMTLAVLDQNNEALRIGITAQGKIAH